MSIVRRLPGLLPLACLILACGGPLQMKSSWSTGEISIDGVQEDWRDGMTYIEKKSMSVGVRNDSEFLYVCLATLDQDLLRQIRATGLVLWFDPKGGKDRSIGIGYPLGGVPPVQRVFRGRQENGDVKRMPDFTTTLSELEILGPDNGDRIRLKVDSQQDIKVKVGDLADRLVYELKVPLRKSSQYPLAIGIDSGLKLGIGIKTGSFKREGMPKRMSGDRPEFPGPPGPGGRPGRGGEVMTPEPFELWISVQISSKEV